MNQHPSSQITNNHSQSVSADLTEFTLHQALDALSPLSTSRSEYENQRVANATTLAPNDTAVSELALFFQMLEWMEIEGSILRTYNELVAPMVTNRQQTDGPLFGPNELRTVEKVLSEVDMTVAQVMARTFMEFNFACGVLNSMIVTFVFAAYPQHFWLLYLTEGLYLLPSNLYNRVYAKPLNRVFTYLDYCWVANMVALISLIGLLVAPVPESIRKGLYVLTIGTACGPLMGAAIVLPFVALLFHNMDTMTGFFIHVFPPMVAYTLRWYSDQVHEAWPRVFKLDYVSDVDYFFEDGKPSMGTAAGSAAIGYLVWFTLYTLWMLTIGLQLPRKDRRNARTGNVVYPRYDTCFHVSMRGGACLTLGNRLWGRSREESFRQMESNHFEARDFVVYMVIHASMSMLAIFVLGYLCYTSQIIHGIFLALLAILCTFRGARRYTYYATKMYSLMLRKHFDLLAHLHMRNEEDEI